MKKRGQILAIPETALDPQLHQRLSELEAENARLRELDETIRRNTRLIWALLDKSHDGITLVTPELIILATVHSVLGHQGDELAGRSVLEFIHPSDHARVREAFSGLLSNPSEAVTYECRVLDQGGQWCWMEVEMTDMLDDTDIQAIVLNNRRVAASKAEEQSSTP